MTEIVTFYFRNLKSFDQYFGIRKEPLFKIDGMFDIYELKPLYNIIKDKLYTKKYKNFIKYIVQGYKEFSIYKFKKSLMIIFKNSKNDIMIEFTQQPYDGKYNVDKLNKNIARTPGLDKYIKTDIDYNKMIIKVIKQFLDKIKT